MFKCQSCQKVETELDSSIKFLRQLIVNDYTKLLIANVLE